MRIRNSNFSLRIVRVSPRLWGSISSSTLLYESASPRYLYVVAGPCVKAPAEGDGSRGYSRAPTILIGSKVCRWGKNMKYCSNGLRTESFRSFVRTISSRRYSALLVLSPSTLFLSVAILSASCVNSLLRPRLRLFSFSILVKRQPPPVLPKHNRCMTLMRAHHRGGRERESGVLWVARSNRVNGAKWATRQFPK